MYSAHIQKWGNSQGLRLPKSLLTSLNIFENDRIELIPSDDGIFMRKATTIKHKTIEERLEAFYSLPLEKIIVEPQKELYFGADTGEEVW